MLIAKTRSTWDQSALAKLVKHAQGPWSGMSSGSTKVSITNHRQKTSSKSPTSEGNHAKETTVAISS